MTNLHSKLTTLLLAVLATLASCVKEGPDTDGPEDDNMVTFTFTVPGESTPSSRAMNSPDESQVAAMDVLLFDVASNGGGYLHHAVAGPVTVDASNNGTFRVRLPAGTFDMVLVANAATEVAAAVSGLNASSTKTTLQQALTFTQTGKWPAASPSHRPIPMWAELSNVNTTGGGSITGFNLTRALAKIDVAVTAGNFKLTEVRLYNPVPRGYVIPQSGKYTGTPPEATAPSVLASWARTATSYGYTSAAGEMTATECKREIYTFEAPAGDGTASAGSNMSSGNTFLVVGGLWGTDLATTYYRIDIATQAANGTVTYLPLKRNHRYEVEIKGVPHRGRTSAADAAAEGPSNIKAELVVRNEADMHYYVYDDRYYIGADDREYRVGSKAGSHSFNVRTDYPTGWRAVASDSETNANAGVTGNWLTTTATGAIGTGTLGFSFTENTDTENDRIGYIHIMAGDRLDAVVKVTQAFKFDLGQITPDPIEYGYVGAFWKKDQTGERLIRIHRSANPSAIDGTWTATVVEGSDWIVLDTKATTDVNIYTVNTADMNQNDGAYQVNSSLTTVSGNAGTTEDIYFRIGLKSKWVDDPLYDKDDNPARYGVILLEYNNNTKKHLIFVRQGEDPDYVMRPEDNNADGTITTEWGGTATRPRPEAGKWSPYNLTAAEFNTGSADPFVTLAVRGGTWTSYPSMAGAYFQWANAINIRAAYNPSGSATLVTNFVNGLWNNLAATYETCPTGYRRPNDGSITALNTTYAIAGSEIRQSLCLNPFAGKQSLTNSDVGGNIQWGYYADGYFDRYTITASGDNIANSTVNDGTTRVAYIGVLFTNPKTYASLFLPASGQRVNNTMYSRGQLNWIYGSTVSESSGYTQPMYVAFGNVDEILFSIHYSMGGVGMMVRCVEE